MIDGLQQTNISLSRGIVRTPSLGEDGELSECVNLIPHKGEIVRIKEPQPLTEDATGLYLYYTLLIEEGVLYFMAAEPLPENLPVVVNYKDGTATFEVLKDTDSHSIAFAGNEDDITSIEIGNKAFYDSLGKKILRGYKLFTFLSPQEVVFPWPNQLTKMPVELQADEILLATNRCADKENLIVRCVDKLAYYRPGKGRHEITQLGTGEVEIITIGQTLVVSQGTTKRYFVWNDEGYKEQDLLNVMPKAKLTLGDCGFTPIFRYSATGTTDCPGYHWKTPSMVNISYLTEQGNAYSVRPVGEDLDKLEQSFTESFWAQYNKQRNLYKEAGAHCFPFYVRWGIQLYDDSIVNLSAPILMMPSSIIRPLVSTYYGALVSKPGEGELDMKWYINFVPRYLYAAFDTTELKGIGEDLIKGVVVFATPEIEAVDNESELWQDGVIFNYSEEAYEDGLGWVNNVSQRNAQSTGSQEDIPLKNTFVLPLKKNKELIADQFNNPTDFYKLAFISWDTFKESNYKVYASMGNGYLPKQGEELPGILDSEYNVYALEKYSPFVIDTTLESLTSQESLSSYAINQSNYSVCQANTTYAYNSRLFYGGVNLKRPAQLSTSQFVADSRLPSKRKETQNSLPLEVYSKLDGSYLTMITDNGLGGYHGETPFLAFPYNEAEGVCFMELTKARAISSPTFSPGGNEVISIPQDIWASVVTFRNNKTSLGGYASWSGITPSLLEVTNDLKSAFLGRTSNIDKAWQSNNYLELNAKTFRANTIVYTKVANPWVIERMVELACGEIYALSSSTEAVSEGQFGEFPLYAFTDNGIYALYLADDGDISAKQASSRDVLIPGSKVLQLDKALVFATEAGLKLLSKPPTQSISDELSGLNIRERDFDVNPDLYLEDALPFEEQIRNARMVYDYANQRIHVFDDLVVDSKEEIRGWQENSEQHVYVGEVEEIIRKTNYSSGYWMSAIVDFTQSFPQTVSLAWENTNLDRAYIPMKAGDSGTVDIYDTTDPYADKSFYEWYDFDFANSKCVINRHTGINTFTAIRDCRVSIPPSAKYWVYQTTGTITRELTYATQVIKPFVDNVYRQKHYVYDIESQQWATQILDTQLTTVVAGYPFSTMQFGNKLMQYTNALEADVVRSGWLLTRPIAFDDPWARKMIADIRIMAQKTNQDSKVSLAIYTSDYRVNWRKLTSLKSRSAKWYRFLIKADFCGLDSLSGITCRWVQRLGNKLR